MTFHELFGEISDDEDEITLFEHAQIPGLIVMDGLLPLDLMLALEPHLRALFEPDIGANQAMRFGNALPSFLDPLLGIAKALLPSNLQSRTPAFDQMIANHYSPGEGIVEHVDLARFEDGVVIFSFLSPLVMDFRYVGQASTSDSYSRDAFPEIENAKHIALLLEAGSAVCLSGESRFNWAHGIKETLSDEFQGRIITRKERISITLRKMKPNQSSEMNSIGNQDNATRQ